MKIHVKCPECGGEVRWQVTGWDGGQMFQVCSDRRDCSWLGDAYFTSMVVANLQAELVKARAMLQEVLTHDDGWSGMEERICHFCGAERDFGRNEPCADDCLITRIKALDPAKRGEESK